jgi:hypothetical protein
MIFGLTMALASALGTNVAFLFKHRGAVLAPPIRVRHGEKIGKLQDVYVDVETTSRSSAPSRKASSAGT